MSNLIVFDLNGVITSEAAYWDVTTNLPYSPRQVPYMCALESTFGCRLPEEA